MLNLTGTLVPKIAFPPHPAIIEGGGIHALGVF